jgi:hypothetical protein
MSPIALPSAAGGGPARGGHLRGPEGPRPDRQAPAAPEAHPPRARHGLLAPLRLCAINSALPPEHLASIASPPPKTLEFPRKAAKAQRPGAVGRRSHPQTHDCRASTDRPCPGVPQQIHLQSRQPVPHRDPDRPTPSRPADDRASRSPRCSASPPTSCSAPAWRPSTSTRFRSPSPRAPHPRQARPRRWSAGRRWCKPEVDELDPGEAPRLRAAAPRRFPRPAPADRQARGPRPAPAGHRPRRRSRDVAAHRRERPPPNGGYTHFTAFARTGAAGMGGQPAVQGLAAEQGGPGAPIGGPGRGG